MERVGLRIPRSLLTILVHFYDRVSSLYVSDYPVMPEARFPRKCGGAVITRNIQRTSHSPGPPFGLVKYRHDQTADTRAYCFGPRGRRQPSDISLCLPPRALDQDRKADCREVRNTAGRIVARVYGERGETTMPPIMGARTDHSAPSSGLRIP